MKQTKILTQRLKGGGGGRVQEVSSIPDWAVPYMQSVGNAATAQYNAGNLGKVAGASGLQQQAFGTGANQMTQTTNMALDKLAGQAGRLEAMANQGAYDPTALKEAAILESGQATAELGKQYGAAGTLGSARQAVQQGAQNASTAAKFAEIDRSMASENFQQRMAAEQGLGASVSGGAQLAGSTASGLANLGAEQRDITQQGMDANWQALQRYASTIYGNPARQSATQSGGGK